MIAELNALIGENLPGVIFTARHVHAPREDGGAGLQALLGDAIIMKLLISFSDSNSIAMVVG